MDSWKGTRVQILNVRILIERCREFNRPLALCLIDYAKAFDCIQWSTMFDDLVLSLFLYGVDTQHIKSWDRCKIDAFEMRCWRRRLLKILWTDQSAHFERTPHHQRLSRICIERGLSFIGHIMRSPRQCLEKLIILGQVEGRCARGLAPTRWSDTIRKVTSNQLCQQSTWQHRITLHYWHEE